MRMVKKMPPKTADGVHFTKFSYQETTVEAYTLKDIELFPNTSTILTGSRSIKTWITACFAGGREATLEWAICHYMIGFDQVYLV